ncbi:uncharacterized protein si:ch73-304f21.1 [Danio rerio]|uniref:Carcinoembryonic antigen-related cell adhesion molecule 3 n=1 Tax=Danio rerio TaxID=7955 RepID=E7FFX5_DANRE|nr:uncharacterized protein si:ch73-304f21.1 [Danio rerio]|eukprot:XP_009294773.1 uncharacterized protein si:ch73-304f21.1 [Danio rerio]
MFTGKEPLFLLSWIGIVHQGLLVAGTEEVKAVRGNPLTLPSGVKEYSRINWMKGHKYFIIAQCRDESPPCKTFRDGLQIDSQTGSLTFINTSSQLSSLYKLQIINKTLRASNKEFTVIFYDPLPVPIVHKSENSSCSQCVLLCSANVTNETTLSWYKGNHFLSSINVSDPNNSISLPVKGNYEDINEYRCVVNNSISNQTKHLGRSELCQSCAVTGLNPGYIGLICLLLLIAGVVIYCRCWKSNWNKTGKNEAAYRYQNGGTGGSPDE